MRRHDRDVRDGHGVLRDDHDVLRDDHGVPHDDHNVPHGAHGVVAHGVHVCVPRDGLERACFHGLDVEQYSATNKRDRDHGRGGDDFGQRLLQLPQ
ncbi:unnamed protein product [Arctia plantaginis]|uniref:Uncharacterized protein n=1 Tax=Arctia plantaginis TaxID=874455 RepID=A0A8S1AE33_ARCPL|nr:unnamed protein product [Arctia plantaginis]